MTPGQLALDIRPGASASAEAGREAVQKPLRVAGLFAGIGGIELGLHEAGHTTELLCEIDPYAQAVLGARFPEIPLVGDVRDIRSLPDVELVAGGFPCQDLSQAGRTAGIGGRSSGLVGEVFRLLADEEISPRWLLLENVPFMLQLDRGSAMRLLARSLEVLGFTWAYRVVDTRSFGLPQRRQRVILLASRTEDPRGVLFHDDAGEPPAPSPEGLACGFYWTEGLRGLGWAVDAVPTMKGGSGLGIPSPPAIRLPDRSSIVRPDIRDAERLQGFDADWTVPAVEVGRRGAGMRWKLVGNAVSVPVARWLGEQLRCARKYDGPEGMFLPEGSPWPTAAWGRAGEARRVALSPWPSRGPYQHLADFLEYPTAPLSLRATEGFWKRAQISSLRFPDGLLADVKAHLERMRRNSVPA